VGGGGLWEVAGCGGSTMPSAAHDIAVKGARRLRRRYGNCWETVSCTALSA
jgi:hypothetical protein